MLAPFKTGEDPRYYEDSPGKLSCEYIYLTVLADRYFVN